MRSPIYWHPLIYRIVMKFLYGTNDLLIYKEIAQEAKFLDVLDVCCGDCKLRKYVPLQKYAGIDISPGFVRSAKKKGLAVEQGDVRHIMIPKKECIVMKSSLYQFYPEHEFMLNKLLMSAEKKLIVSEPYKNLSSSRNWFVRKISQIATNPGTEYAGVRFDEETLTTLFKRCGALTIKKAEREIIGIFLK